MDWLYHYTNVETLALIMSRKTIRFNALNRVDDLQEKETADLKNLGQFCFVSCWTEDPEEQIPMWKMYGNIESGVRIKLRTFPFKNKDNIPSELERVTGNPVADNTNGTPLKSLLTAAELMEKKVITPGLVQQSNILFKVEYSTDKEKLYPRVLSQDESGTQIDLGKLGKYKNKGWSFQKEWRYIVLFLPLDISDVTNAEVRFAEMMRGMISGKSVLPFSYYDIDIDDDAFSEMEIMLSPKLSPGNRVLVKDLVEKYNPSAKIVESIYKGLIN